MTEHKLAITASGGVLLGEDVVCDGFIRDVPYRVQTHIHRDHCSHFETSKGYQDILLTESTKNLLIHELNADLSYRQNLKALKLGMHFAIPNGKVLALSNGHMLGSIQVAVEYNTGHCYGYSSDFSWPLKEVIQVEALVIDSTCGSPQSIRKYIQEEAENELVRVVNSRAPFGPIHLKAHRGTLARTLQVLCTQVRIPIVGSPRFITEVNIYRKNGYILNNIADDSTPEGDEIVKTNRYIRIFGLMDQLPVDPQCTSTINISAFGMAGEHPVLNYSEGAYRIALSDHADFEGTLEYIKATNASFVLTDNSRGGNALELAEAIRKRLGIKAAASENDPSREWGI